MAVPTQLESSPVIHRYPKNPVLTKDDVPYDSTLVFNAGVVKFAGRYVMVFRNDYGTWGVPEFDGINLGLAFSDDGIKWKVEPKPCLDIDDEEKEIECAYDPRLSVIDGKCYMCCAVNTKHGIRGGIAVTEDFEDFDFLSMSVPDNRNMVLFPETFDGKYIRLERPFSVYSGRHPDHFDIWISDSSDLRYWGNSELLLGAEAVAFANEKIGAGPPPVRTDKGWLVIFHAVDISEDRGKNGWEDEWKRRYTAGVMLLDLDNPRKIIGWSQEPLITPEAPYETQNGYRHNVIFPCGAILEDDGEVKIYYGAADTVECLATAHVDDLLSLCKPAS